LAARTGEVRVRLDESVIDELPVFPVFAVEVLFDGFLADDLVAQQAVERGRAALGEQHVGLEDSPEDEAAERAGRGF
jgi:hypothetical protein